jgi:hypothetical protein
MSLLFLVTQLMLHCLFWSVRSLKWGQCLLGTYFWIFYFNILKYKQKNAANLALRILWGTKNKNLSLSILPQFACMVFLKLSLSCLSSSIYVSMYICMYVRSICVCTYLSIYLYLPSLHHLLSVYCIPHLSTHIMYAYNTTNMLTYNL